MVLAKYKVHITVAVMALGVFLVNKHYRDQITLTRYKPLVGQIETQSDIIGEDFMQEITPLVHIAAYSESLSKTNIDESVFTPAPAPVEVESMEVVEAAPVEEEPELEEVTASEWDVVDGRLKLQSIFGISGSRRGAIINGRGRHMGDTFTLYSAEGGTTKIEVKAIGDRSVLLAIGDEVKEFTL